MSQDYYYLEANPAIIVFPTHCPSCDTEDVDNFYDIQYFNGWAHCHCYICESEFDYTIGY